MTPEQARQGSNTRYLSKVRPGEKVRLVSVDGGAGLRDRMSALGLLPGTEIDVVKNSEHGPVVLKVKGTRMVLGRGMSAKIIVA